MGLVRGSELSGSVTLDNACIYQQRFVIKASNTTLDCNVGIVRFHAHRCPAHRRAARTRLRRLGFRALLWLVVELAERRSQGLEQIGLTERLLELT